MTVDVGSGGTVTLFPDGHAHGSFGHGQGNEDTVVNTVVVGSAQLNDSAVVGAVGLGEIVGGFGSVFALLMGLPGNKGENGENGDGKGVGERDESGLVVVSVAPGTSESEAQVAQRSQRGGLPTSTDTVQSSGEVRVAVVGPGSGGPVGSPTEQMEVGSLQAMRQMISGLVKVAVMVGVAQDAISAA